MQQHCHVAIKCVRQLELNALGEREAAALRQVNDQDVDDCCAGRSIFKIFVLCDAF